MFQGDWMEVLMVSHSGHEGKGSLIWTMRMMKKINRTKLTGNTGGTRTGMEEEGENIQTIGWVKTDGWIQREMERHKCISGEPRLTGRENSEWNAAISAANHAHQQHVFQSLGVSRSVWEEAECKLRSVEFRRESDPRRAFRPAFTVTGIFDHWYRSTMGAGLISLGAPETVAQPMWESQTNSERCLGSYGYSFKGLQVLSEILQMYMSNKNSFHVWCIDYCSLSTSKSYYTTQHVIKHSMVCIAELRRTKENDEWFKNESR